MHRYPDGVDRPGFWHKEVPSHAPEWLVRWHNPEADPGETECYVVPDGLPALVWLADFGTVVAEMRAGTGDRQHGDLDARAVHEVELLVDRPPGPGGQPVGAVVPGCGRRHHVPAGEEVRVDVDQGVSYRHPTRPDGESFARPRASCGRSA
jgi:hypothetical protein